MGTYLAFLVQSIEVSAHDEVGDDQVSAEDDNTADQTSVQNVGHFGSSGCASGVHGE